MSLLSEIKAAVTGCGLSVETGVFSGEPPEEYVVVTPLADTYELHADNLPGYETQEARLSLFSNDRIRSPGAGHGLWRNRPESRDLRKYNKILLPQERTERG